MKHSTALTFAFGAALVLSAPVAAQPDLTLTLESPTPQPFAGFGERAIGLPDIDGDGRADFAVGAPFETAGGMPEAGRVHVFSGSDGALLYTIEAPTPVSESALGEGLAVLSDADGDGRADLLVGAPFETVNGEEEAGRAYAFSGATGAFLYALDPPAPSEEGAFGLWSLGLPGGDVLIGAPFETVDGMESAGRVYRFDGATGSLTSTITSPEPQPGGDFGRRLASVPDVDGDGMAEVAVAAFGENGGAEDSGRVHLFSGATGALLRTVPPPNPQNETEFGTSIAGVPDADGDGFGDLAVAALSGGGDVYLFSGATGALLWSRAAVGGEPRLAGIADIGGDRRGDVLVGTPFEDGGSVAESGRAVILSGAAGTPQFTFDSPAPESGGQFGFAVGGIVGAEMEGFFVTAPNESGGAENAGRVYVFGTAPTTSAEADAAPLALSLNASPNPFTARTTIRYALAAAGPVRLEVYDLLGRRVAVLHDGLLAAAGEHALAFDAVALPAGVYLVRAEAEAETAVRKVTLLR